MRRPLVKLERALYGHPEAGGHWEKHLEKIIKTMMGGQPVPDHPSCFWFPSQELFLIVYVDDLLLAGPAHHHAEFWKKLGSKVNLEPAEELDRYLGRHHRVEEIERLDYDLIDWFDSPVGKAQDEAQDEDN